MLAGSLLSVLAALPSVHAWGEIGHRTVAYLAELQFSGATEAMVNHVFRKEYSEGKDISDLAVWADDVKITPAYDWSKGLHFTGGGPPAVLSCNITVCAEKTCIIRAIANVSGILTQPKNSPELQAEALKFLIHFVGDLHQPLHANNYKRGGNDIPITFDGVSEFQNRSLRLHSVWDDYMARKFHGLDFLKDDVPLEKETANKWATTLESYNQKSNDFFLHEECIEPMQGTKCPTAWAEESNSLVCPRVFAGNLTWVTTNDLYRSSYYAKAAPLMERRIQQAGNRLAAWLNAISTLRLQALTDEL